MNLTILAVDIQAEGTRVIPVQNTPDHIARKEHTRDTHVYKVIMSFVPMAFYEV